MSQKSIAMPTPKPTLGVVKNETKEPSLVVKENLSFDDRMHRLNELFVIQSKFLRLERSKAKLTSFTIAQDKDSSTLSISDDARNRFETSNPEIIQEVVEFIKKRISEKQISLQPQINW
jgi:hypothetical protein